MSEKGEHRMIIESVSLPVANRLARDYQQGKADALQFFHYQPYQNEAYRERIEWLNGKSCPHRERLVEGLYAYNQQIGNHPEALTRIEQLRRSDAYVVIGGQQAGVLTGPLYTIHKAIHLIQSARKLQEELQVTIVPVFWIAGEDHDIDEIDHLYWLTDGETVVSKGRMNLPRKGRVSASSLRLEQEAAERFVDSFLQELTETEETAAIRDLLKQEVRQSSTVVDWFARLMASLFGKHGLVLVESSLPFVRELERPVFRRLIEQNERISSLLEETSDRIIAAGYEPQLQVEGKQANLFVYESGERLLLERSDDRFRTKDRRYSYSKDELLTMLEADPRRFSANVVSRPLMQEHLFPTLAFIGGQGEVAYWAFYRKVFEAMGYQLPIVLPRMSITLVEGAIARLMEQVGLSVEKVLTGFGEWKEQWERLREPDPLKERFAQTRQAMEALYRPLITEVVERDAGLRELAEKNINMLLAQVDFLEDRLNRSLRRREDVSLARVRRIEASLLPEGAWQERKLSVFFFANKYGLDLVDRLVAAPFRLDGSHQIVYL
jgi:bacillithiol biosynthesis cysteine-adding enzyme BshC